MSDRALALRRDFDDSFSRRSEERTDGRVRLLCVRIAADGYAFRLDEIASFVAARKIVPLASSIPAALGVAGLRGALVPVYSLAGLLGRAADDEPPRWFVLGGGAETVALAFAHFEGYAEVARAELVGSVARIEARHFNVISIPSMVESISARVVGATPKER